MCGANECVCGPDFNMQNMLPSSASNDHSCYLCAVFSCLFHLIWTFSKNINKGENFLQFKFSLASMSNMYCLLFKFYFKFLQWYSLIILCSEISWKKNYSHHASINALIFFRFTLTTI